MRKLLPAFLFSLAFASTCSAILWVVPSRPAAAAAPTYLINQNFETATTGYDNGPESWTGSGTVDPASTTTIIVGTQSCRITSAEGSITSADFTGQTDVWAFCRIRPIDGYFHGAGGSLPIVSIQTTGGTVLAAFRAEYSGGVKWYLYADAADTAVSGFAPSSATNYYLWMRFVSGGTCELYISASDTRPTVDSGTELVLTKTGASGTAAKIVIKNGTGNGGIVVDRVLVSASEIGNNP